MAIVKAKDAAKMNATELNGKVKDLRIELIKAKAANKKGGKTSIRAVKRTIARLLTFENRLNKNKKAEEKTQAKPKTEAKKVEAKKI